jgi:CTD small phosphatase-like protein 2
MCDGGVCNYSNELDHSIIDDLKFTCCEFENDEEDDDLEFITSLNKRSFDSKFNISIDTDYSKMTNNFESFKSAMAYFKNDKKRSNSIGLKKRKKNIEAKKKRLNVIKAGKNNNNINQNSDFPSFKKERVGRKESVNSRDKTHCTNSSNKFDNSETYIADSISEIKNTDDKLEIEKTESSRKRYNQTNNSKTRHKVLTSRKKVFNKTNLNNIHENDESFDNVSKKLEFDSISEIITENSNILQEKPIIPISNASINNANKMKKSSFENITYDFYDSAHNKQNNYMEYVNKVLKSQVNFNKLDFTDEIEKRKFELPPTDKKHTIILDLDETLVHSDFDYHYRNSDSDFIQTTGENAANSNLNEKSQLEFHDTFFSDDETGEEIKIRFYVRPGLTQFLKNLTQNFQVGIFTAGIKEYAESVLKILDPNNEIFSFNCFRESCIKVGRAYVKDLRIFEEHRSLSNIVILDNNLYSFANQLSNGILINSFYQEAEDKELMNLEMYIHEYLAKCEDIKFVNEQVFKFENTLDNHRLFTK